MYGVMCIVINSYRHACHSFVTLFNAAKRGEETPGCNNTRLPATESSGERSFSSRMVSSRWKRSWDSFG